MSNVGNILRDEQKPNVIDLGNYAKSIRIARILRVYDAEYLKNLSSERDKYGKVDILFLDGPGTVPVQIPFLTPWFSWTRGSGIMFMPEQNDIVACQIQHNGYPIIIGFLPYRWDKTLNKPVELQCENLGSTRPLKKGEIFIKSSFGNGVLLNEHGSVEITGTDSSRTNTVISNLDNQNFETTFERVQSEEDACISKTIIGNSYLIDGASKFVGSSPQIFESGTSEYFKQSLVLPHAESVSFNLTADTEIYKIISVTVAYTDDSGVSKSVELRENQYTLSTENIYTPGAQDDLDVYYKPSTIERNTVKYTLTVPVYNYSNAITTISFYAKHFVGGIRVNSLGDLFLDGRNVIVRSSSEKSTLSLLESGKVRLRGSGNTVIGNADGGQISCSYGGVQYSQGVAMEQLNPDTLIEKQNIWSALGVEDQNMGAIFYISDAAPLVRLFKENGGKWTYKAVTEEEYRSLSTMQKCTVNKLTVSVSNLLFTEEKLAKLMTENVPTYGELKQLG